ncbi:hypothetical protein [Sphingomonas profundi]|uniref:hypothetical protein n=1 Tax=Alterirhizorhabdus profundi TaxID=2681549 RepID=UPI0012E71F35|nr:hypothetical protein [Sphingomonas profundi]
MIATVLALVAAAPAVAQATPPTPPGQPRGAAAMKALGMSDAGVAVLRRQSAPDPDAKALLAKRQAMRAKLAEAAAATPFDVDAFAALLRESSLMEASARSRSEERIVTTLKALPAADRPIFAKAVFGAGGPPPAPPGPPPPPRPAP